jgi:hypothetical protein
VNVSLTSELEDDHARSVRLTRFNQELGDRLDTLDRSQHVSPADARARLKSKSEQRRDAVSPE